MRHGRSSFARRLAALVALAPLLAASHAGALVPTEGPFDVPTRWNPLVNGGFESCLDRDVALGAHLGREGGRVACAPWSLRRATPGPFGYLPRSTSQGLPIGYGGRVGVLHVKYDASDHLVLLEQPFSVPGLTVYADAGRVKFDVRADQQVRLGVHLVVRGPDGRVELLPPQGAPVTVPGLNEWRSYDLPFFSPNGDLLAFAFEIHVGTPDGTRIEFDRAVLEGAVVRPRATA